MSTKNILFLIIFFLSMGCADSLPQEKEIFKDKLIILKKLFTDSLFVFDLETDTFRYFSRYSEWKIQKKSFIEISNYYQTILLIQDSTLVFSNGTDTSYIYNYSKQNRVGIVNKDEWFSLANDENQCDVFFHDEIKKMHAIDRSQIEWSLVNIEIFDEKVFGSDTRSFFYFDTTGNMMIQMRNKLPLLSIFSYDNQFVTLQTDRDKVFLQLGNREINKSYKNNGLLLRSGKKYLFRSTTGETCLLLRDLDRDFAVGGGDYHCLNLETGEIVRLYELSKTISMYEFLGIAEKSQENLFR